MRSNIRCLHFRAPSPLPRGPHNMYAASPIDSLPHTAFPHENQQQQYQQQHQPQQQQYQPYQPTQPKQEQHVNYPPPPPPRSCFSPQLTRDHYQGFDSDNSAIQNQVSTKISHSQGCSLKPGGWRVECQSVRAIFEFFSWKFLVSLTLDIWQSVKLLKLSTNIPGHNLWISAKRL